MSARGSPTELRRATKLASKLVREVVLERELQLEPVGAESVREVGPASPLQLNAGHRIRHRRVEQVAEKVLAGLECVGRLSVAVVDVLAGIADRRGELRIPRVVHEEAQGRHRQGLADDRSDGVLRVLLDADVDGRIVHRVLDAGTHDERPANDIVLTGLEVGRKIEAPAGGAARQVEFVVEVVVPIDLAQLAGDARVAPVVDRLVGGREVRNREAGGDVLQLDTIGVDALVAAGAGALEREHQVAVLVRDRRPADLDVAVPRQAGRPPVLERVGERVRVGKRAPVLAGTELTQLTPRMAQPERRLAGVHAGAEQLELEDGLELAQTRRRRRLDPEAALSHTGKAAVVLAELVLEGWQPRQAKRVVPIRIDLREVVSDVQHRKAVDLHRRLRFVRRRLALGSSGRAPEADQQNHRHESLH